MLIRKPSTSRAQPRPVTGREGRHPGGAQKTSLQALASLLVMIACALAVGPAAADDANRVTSETAFDHSNPRWSPEGDRLAFDAYGAGQYDIGLVDMATGAESLLTADPARDHTASWSPNGTTLAFASNRSGAWDIWTIPVDGGFADQVTNGPTSDWSPAWSPDGELLAFSSDRSGNWDIWVAATTGGEMLRVTDDTADDRNPYWSPDGSRLVFASDRDGHWHLWTIQLAVHSHRDPVRRPSGRVLPVPFPLVDSGQEIGEHVGYDVALGDVDGDGDADALVGNSHQPPDATNPPQPLTLWLNGGNGLFSESGQNLGEARHGFVALADLDSDGDPECVLCKRDPLTENGPNTVLINHGGGRFGDWNVDFGNSATMDGAVGDLDGDGDLDIFTANVGLINTQPNKVWLNRAARSLVADGRGGGGFR